jgi:hypothetical protein
LQIPCNHGKLWQLLSYLSENLTHQLLPNNHCPMMLNSITLVSFLIFCSFQPCHTYTHIKSTIFWDITPYSPLSVNRHFGGTYCLHLQGRKNKLSKKPE